jgi:hypothetical protein
MPHLRSRTADLKRMASYVGNGAAHVALYKDYYAIVEEANYLGDASEIAERRTWNENDLAFFRKEAYKIAVRVIKAKHNPGRHDSLDIVRQNTQAEIENLFS